jgi:N-acyl-D-amino-acid deacylase
VKKLVIKNGQIIDGTGSLASKADIEVSDNIITEVGPVDCSKATKIIDAQGLVVAPGFIDMHSHADFTLPVIPTANSLVHQGITTAVVGQCGMTPAPLLDWNRKEVIAISSRIVGGSDAKIPWESWSSFGEFLDFLAHIGTSLNIVPLVGHRTIRASVMGYADSRVTADQMKQMKTEITKAIEEGAFGLSTGLIYPPGSYSLTEELIELTRVVGDRDGFYFSHIRGEAETLLEAVAEAIQIGRETGAPVQISHFKAAGRQNWDKSALALELIDSAVDEGLNISMDMYPYTAGSTTLVSMLPPWVQEGGEEATLDRLSDKAMRENIEQEMKTAGFAKSVEWDKVLITNSPNRPDYQGRFVSVLADETDKRPHDWVFDALVETELQISMAVFGMSEQNRKNEMKHPAMTFGTDGLGLAVGGELMKQSQPHPRSYGTFPRVLGRYVRDLGELSLEEAIHKMTGLAAKRLRLKDRGLVKSGMIADLVVFDPATVIDKATYENPHQYPEGIFDVIVNGEIVVRDKVHTGVRPGQILTRN